MRFAKLTPIVAILALAACDNATETAETPVIEDEAAVTEQAEPVETELEQETAEAATELEQGADAVGREAAELGTELEQGAEAIGEETADAATALGNEVEEETAALDPADPNVTVVTPEGGEEADVTVVTPEAGSQTATNSTGTMSTGGEATGSISATTAAMIDPGTYASDSLSLELAEGGTFTLTGAGGDEVTGDWRVFDDTMTLSNASGATGDASFPMTCTITEEGEGFRISAQTSSCEMLDGQVFQPQS